MPYAVLEKKISMVPPQFMDELSAFVDFILFKQGKSQKLAGQDGCMRLIRPLPGYGSKISVKGDIFSDDSNLWENA
jgi:hypothetical protein